MKGEGWCKYENYTNRRRPDGILFRFLSKSGRGLVFFFSRFVLPWPVLEILDTGHVTRASYSLAVVNGFWSREPRITRAIKKKKTLNLTA